MTSKPVHYFVAEFTYKGSIPKVYCALFSSLDDNKIHWNDSLSWCIIKGFETFKIIKDYGWVQVDKRTAAGIKTIEAIIDDYGKNYALKPLDLETNFYENILGWLSPEGEFFTCKYEGHTELAEDIIKYRYDKQYAFIQSEFLFKRGWFELSDGGLLRGMYGPLDERIFLNDKQISVLNKIIANHPDPDIVENITENMSLWIKEDENA